MKQKNRSIKSLSIEEEKEIVDLYKNKKTKAFIGAKFNLLLKNVKIILLKHNIKIRKHQDYFWQPTAKDVEDIKNLYLKEHRGIQFIAKQYNTTWNRIKKILLNNNVELLTRNQLMIANRKHYGITRGFSGKKHKLESRKKISQTLKKRPPTGITGSKSQFINTIIGKVQGLWELAYLQQCINLKKSLPRIGKYVKTPLGIYYPDFEYEHELIEIKSPFTWMVCKGLIENPKRIRDHTQYKKIQWTSENIKKVNIVILNQEEVKSLIKEVIDQDKLLIDNLIYYHNGQYKINKNE